MTQQQTEPLRERNRQAARELILDAAETLLKTGDSAEFSMRALAEQAGVGFATPFNHFGSKAAIMQALSARLIRRMAAQFIALNSAGDTLDQVLVMCDVAVELLLEQPAVYKALVASLGAVTREPSDVMRFSLELWALALGKYLGVVADLRPKAGEVLPAQLAIGFRGCLSFWIAGELDDQALRGMVRQTACATLLGFLSPQRRALALSSMRATASQLA